MDTLSPLNAATGPTAASGTSGAAAAREKLSTDYDSFLTLLVAQVSNQDPLEPMDSTAFVSQLAQLTQVEQAITSNETLEKISAQLDASGARSDVMLIGRDVLVPSDRLSLGEGEARFSYSVKEGAQEVTARILAEDGTELRRIDGLPVASGTRHEVVWDGRDSEGLPVPPGDFRIELTALDAEEEPVFHSTFASGTVERVAFRDGWPMLGLDTGAEVEPDSVISVR